MSGMAASIRQMVKGDSTWYRYDVAAPSVTHEQVAWQQLVGPRPTCHDGCHDGSQCGGGEH